MKTTKMLTNLFLSGWLMLWTWQVAMAGPVGTAFTYQGRLIDANIAADGLYDFQFKLYDANSDGNNLDLGTDVNKSDVGVIDGYFTVELDFGSVFDGNDRWLDISVRPGEQSDPNVYTALSPRQKLTPTPYAIRSLSGGDSLWQVNGSDIYYNNGNVGIGTNQPISTLHVAGSLLVRRPGEAGVYLNGASDNVIVAWNDGSSGYNKMMLYSDKVVFTDTGNVGIGTTSPGDKLDVSGHINSSESYKLDGETILSNIGTNNIFVGEDAGTSHTDGNNNSAVGYRALYANDTGSYNSAMGKGALYCNTEGYDNSAMGCNALVSNTTGNNNSAIGTDALYSNTEGLNNTAVGRLAGASNYTGSGNVFLGFGAGFNETGSNKLYIANSDVNNLIYGDFSAGNVGIGTTSPAATLHVAGGLLVRRTGEAGLYLNGASDYVTVAWNDGSTGYNKMMLYSDKVVFTDTGNVGIGTTSPARRLHVSDVMRLQPRASAPSSPAEGDIYYDSGTHTLMVYNGTMWKPCF